jgi:hypothetical protein
MTSPLTKPVEWLVFYSEKAGREYYYEPNSKIVTWIVPDDLHPNGTATGIETKAPVQQHHHQQQPTMARRVSKRNLLGSSRRTETRRNTVSSESDRIMDDLVDYIHIDRPWVNIQSRELL